MALFDLKKFKKNAPRSTAEESEKRSVSVENVTDSKEKVLSVRDTLRLVYCLMAVDGAISSEEIDKVTEIGKGLDPAFDEYEKDLLALSEKLTGMYAQAVEKDDYYDLVHDEASSILSSTGAPGQVASGERS
jgi:hypothetical protein